MIKIIVIIFTNGKQGHTCPPPVQLFVSQGFFRLLLLIGSRKKCCKQQASRAQQFSGIMLLRL